MFVYIRKNVIYLRLMEEETKAVLDNYIFKNSILIVFSDEITKIIKKYKAVPKILNDPFYFDFIPWCQIIHVLFEDYPVSFEIVKYQLPYKFLLPVCIKYEYKNLSEIISNCTDIKLIENIIEKSEKTYLIKNCEIFDKLDINIQIKIYLQTNDLEKICSLIYNNHEIIIKEAIKQKKFDLIKLIISLYHSDFELDTDIILELIKNNIISHKYINICKNQKLDKLVDILIETNNIFCLHHLDNEYLCLTKEHMIKIKNKFPNFKFDFDGINCPFNEKMENYHLNSTNFFAIQQYFKDEFYTLLIKNPNFFVFEKSFHIRNLDMSILLKCDKFEYFFNLFISNCENEWTIINKLSDIEKDNFELCKIIYNSTACLNIIFITAGRVFLKRHILHYINKSNDKDCINLFLSFCLEKNIIVDNKEFEFLKN